jgi:hypothetical protein
MSHHNSNMTISSAMLFPLDLLRPEETIFATRLCVASSVASDVGLRSASMKFTHK